MDGNGRWAKDRGLARTAGHEAGEKVLFDLVEAAIGFGVKELSAYAFSTENWKRTPEEVKFLMGYSRDVLRRRRDRLNEMGVKIQWIGRPQRLWKSVISELEEAQESAAFDAAELLRISEELENQRTELNTREEEWLEITDQLGD